MYIKPCLYFPLLDNVEDIHYDKHNNAVSSTLGSLKSTCEESQAKKKGGGLFFAILITVTNIVIDSGLLVHFDLGGKFKRLS